MATTKKDAYEVKSENRLNRLKKCVTQRWADEHTVIKVEFRFTEDKTRGRWWITIE